MMKLYTLRRQIANLDIGQRQNNPPGRTVAINSDFQAPLCLSLDFNNFSRKLRYSI